MSTTTALPENYTVAESFYALPSQIEEIIKRDWTVESAFSYCSNLANTHYENFHVGSWFFPKELRPHLYAIYAYCRWSDDLADEESDKEIARSNLDMFASWVEDTYAGNPPNHPVFIALAETIKTYPLPKQAFLNLLKAFTWDLDKTRWENYDELKEYCVYSANPVGRLFLALYRVTDPEAERLSDFTCTGLQLANHWADVAKDIKIGRIYIPQSDMKEFGITEQDIDGFINGNPIDERWTQLMAKMVGYGKEQFIQGAALSKMLPRSLKIDVRLFTLGGWAILDRIEKNNFDIFNKRPRLSTGAKASLFFKALILGDSVMPK